jgi:hypothetical protein
LAAAVAAAAAGKTAVSYLKNLPLHLCTFQPLKLESTPKSHKMLIFIIFSPLIRRSGKTIKIKQFVEVPFRGFRG